MYMYVDVMLLQLQPDLLLQSSTCILGMQSHNIQDCKVHSDTISKPASYFGGGGKSMLN